MLKKNQLCALVCGVKRGTMANCRLFCEMGQYGVVKYSPFV